MLIAEHAAACSKHGDEISDTAASANDGGAGARAKSGASDAYICDIVERIFCAKANMRSRAGLETVWPKPCGKKSNR